MDAFSDIKWNKDMKIGNPLTKTERGFFYGEEKRNSVIRVDRRGENEVRDCGGTGAFG